MDKSKRLIGHGFLPKELPNEFTSIPLADNYAAISAAITSVPAALPVVFSLARGGHARRILRIPHPAHFIKQAEIISVNWPAISAACSRSALTVSKPTFRPKSREKRNRATNLAPVHNLPQLRLWHASAHQFVLQTDVARFFSSIYTHSIPWALHGKAVAKKDTSSALFGNALDKAVRNGQDKQTMGIPVGPDTSHIISEVIASALDAEAFPDKVDGFRYVDDYFLCFDSEGEARAALERLANVARNYELELNYEKTEIRPIREVALDVEGFNVLSGFPFDDPIDVSDKELDGFFSAATALAETHENAFKYAIRMLAERDVSESDWNKFESYLLRSASLSPNCLDVVAYTLFRWYSAGRRLNIERIARYLGNVIIDGLAYGRHSEVVWALWLHKALSLPVAAPVTASLTSTNNSVVALLALDLQSKGLLKGSLDRTPWNSLISKAEFYREHWLLVYEGTLRGWLPSNPGLSGDACYAALKAHNISFYDPDAVEKLIRKTKRMSRRRIRSLALGSFQNFLAPLVEADDDDEEVDVEEYY